MSVYFKRGTRGCKLAIFIYFALVSTLFFIILLLSSIVAKTNGKPFRRNNATVTAICILQFAYLEDVALVWILKSATHILNCLPPKLC